VFFYWGQKPKKRKLCASKAVCIENQLNYYKHFIIMNIKKFTFNPWQENSYVIYDDHSGECALVDMGSTSEDDNEELAAFLEEESLTVKYIMNTHLHIDHILGNYSVKQRYNAPLLAHENDEFLIENAETYAEQIGFKLDNTPPSIDEFIEDGQEITLGDIILKVIHVPGHTPGSVVFYSEKNKFLLSGDVLFFESIGRTDLIYGNHTTLVNGITSKLFAMPDDVTVYPGHGPQTSIGHEKGNNPFLKHLC
jgi:hydroxyacylglutathione hydrolase